MNLIGVTARFVLCACLAAVSQGGDRWVVREGGVGAATIGMSLAQLNTALHQKFSAPAEKDEERCFYVSPWGHDHVAFMIVDGKFARIDVDAPGVPTTSGIQVGDSEAHAREVYGSRVKVTPHAYTDSGHYLTVRSADGRFGIRFETNNGKITAFYAGRYAAIQYIEGCE